MSTLWQDVRYAVRLMAKSPGFTLVAVLSLALGIGATTAIFSLMDRVMLRTLPVDSPERLVTVSSKTERGQLNTSFSYPFYKDLRDRNEAFSGLIGFGGVALHLSDSGEPERVSGLIVTGNFFPVLGVEPAVGQLISEADDRTPGAHPVAVVSYKLWKRRFASDPALVGKTIGINGHSFTVIGITPAEFTGVTLASSPDIYVPMMMLKEANPSWAMVGTTSTLDSRQRSWLETIGRLKPGISREQAESSLAITGEQIAQENPMNAWRQFELGDGSRGFDFAVREISGPLVWLMVAVALVLLIACANIANLLLARASARRKEIAIRLAVGASRARLVRQLLTESVLLSLVGGAAGIAVAVWLIDVLLAFKPSINFMLDVNLDKRVLAFSLGVSVLTGIIFGLAPALGSSKANLVSALKDESGSLGRGSRRLSLRGALVVVQVALSLVVLVCAGLSLKSLQNLLAIETGFDPAKVLVVSLDVSLNGYDEERGKQFYSQLVERVSALPGVESASVAAIVPLGGGGMRRSVRIEGYEPPPGAPPLNFDMNIVEPNYFKTMRIPLLAGRGFTDGDAADTKRVVIINETIAARFWPDQNAVGEHLDFGRAENPLPVEIIGVVKNGKYRNLTEQPLAAMYLPIKQSERTSRMALHVRSATDLKAVTAAIRNEIKGLDPNLPLYDIRTLEEQKANSLYSSRMVATLLAGFGALAMLLAALGLYGVMAYSVNRRTREIGIRMALGANSADVLKLVLREGMLLVLAGLVLGLGVTFWATRFISSMLYGVSATDLTTFVGIAALLAVAAMLACYIPARRAAKVDPMIALRYE